MTYAGPYTMSMLSRRHSRQVQRRTRCPFAGLCNDHVRLSRWLKIARNAALNEIETEEPFAVYIRTQPRTHLHLLQISCLVYPVRDCNIWSSINLHCTFYILQGGPEETAPLCEVDFVPHFRSIVPPIKPCRSTDAASSQIAEKSRDTLC